MKLAIFGASGRTGRLLVEQSLAAGHDVTAFVRNPAKLTASHPKLRVVQGAADQPQAIADAVAGSDAVISAMGSGKGTLTVFTPNLVPAMKAAGVARLVSLVGAAVSEPEDPQSVGRTVMLTIMNLVARDILSDAVEHARQLRTSHLDWTLVRPPRLADGPAKRVVNHAQSMKLGPSASITRADLAAFMLDCAVNGLYIRQSPMVANGV